MIPLTDEYLIKRIKEDHDNKCLLELVSRHSGIYIEMIRRYGSRSLNQTQLNDMMDEKDYNIYNAAVEHDVSKSKFSTYLANKTRYICLSNKTVNKKNGKMVNFDEIEFNQEAHEDNPAESSSKSEFLSKVCFLIEHHDDPRVVTIFKERYFSTDSKKLKPWKNIAPDLGLSVQGCIYLHNKAINKFRIAIKNGQTTL